MEPLLHRLALFIKKKSKKKEAAEGLANALSAIEDLEKAIEDMKESGRRMKDLVEKAQIPIQFGVADKLYQEIGVWMVVMARINLGLVRLARQAKSVTQYETFMSDLKHLDKPVYESLQMFARSYKDGKVDVSEMPTFIALYGPRELGREMEKAQKEQLEPLTKKLEGIVETIPLPIRHRVKDLGRSYNGLSDSRSDLVEPTEEVIHRMLDSSPPWMRSFTQVIEKASKRSVEIAAKRALGRVPSKKPTPSGQKWPPGKMKAR